MKYHDRMEIDFVKCESERPRSETCGAKSETRHSASFPSNYHPGMSQHKRQSAAKRAANNLLLTMGRKQEGHVKSVCILKLKSSKFLPPHYTVHQGFTQAFANATQTVSEIFPSFYYLISHIGKIFGPFDLIITGASSHFLGQSPCYVYRKTLHRLLGQTELMACTSLSSLSNWLEICLKPCHPAQDVNAARTQLRNSSLLFLHIWPHTLQNQPWQLDFRSSFQSFSQTNLPQSGSPIYINQIPSVRTDSLSHASLPLPGDLASVGSCHSHRC